MVPGICMLWKGAFRSRWVAIVTPTWMLKYTITLDSGSEGLHIMLQRTEIQLESAALLTCRRAWRRFTVWVWDSDNNADDPLSHPQTFYITSTGCRNNVKQSAYGGSCVIFDYCFNWVKFTVEIVAWFWSSLVLQIWMVAAYKVIAVWLLLLTKAAVDCCCIIIACYFK